MFLRFCTALLAFAASMAATPLTLTFSGTGSGTLNGAPFYSAAFSFTFTTDTALVTKPPCCNTRDTPSGTPATFSITGAGSGTLADKQAIFVDPARGDVGLAHYNGNDLIDISSAALVGYSLSGSIGPVTAMPFLVGACPGIDCASYVTSVGVLSFNSVSTATFTAVAGAGSSNSIITTVAGNGTAGYSGDGGPAVSTQLNDPVFVSADVAGNMYIADQNNHRIRKVDTSGTITTVAGTGTLGYSGDGGPATQATLNLPTGVFAAPNGDLLINDTGNGRVRRVDASGNITTVAGNGGKAFSGDGGPGVNATLYNAVRAVENASGVIYIADQSNHRVRKIDAAGTITTIAGTGAAGFGGDNGPAVSATLNNPTSVALDASGNLFISDQFNHRIRKIAVNGIITTVAGTGNAGFSGDGGLANIASLNYPGGLVVDSSGNVFFADDINFRVRKIDTGGTITTVAGTGVQGFSGDGGAAIGANLNGQFGVALDPSGNLLIADSTNNRIRRVATASPVNPVFSNAALTNSASFKTGASPGQLATVFGQHLSVNLSGIAAATTVPIATTLAGTSITINGVAAPILAVANIGGQEQINFQIPWEAEGLTTAQMVISNGVASSTPVPIAITQSQPGLFAVDGVNGAILHLNGSLVSASNPATANEIVVVFATGLGPVNPPLVTGEATPATVLTSTTTNQTVTIGGLPATVLFSGQAPYFVGLNQLNLRVPGSAAPGSLPVVVTSGGGSNSVKIELK